MNFSHAIYHSELGGSPSSKKFHATVEMTFIWHFLDDPVLSVPDLLSLTFSSIYEHLLIYLLSSFLTFFYLFFGGSNY